MQQTNNIRFCHIENHQLIAFYKWNEDKTDEVLVIINLDSHYSQRGMLQLPLGDLLLDISNGINMHDLITDNSYLWYDEWNFVELHPALPFHMFHIKK